MTSIITGQDCYLTLPEWEAIRQRCKKRSADVDPVMLDSKAVLATLPTLLRDVRLACVHSPDPHAMESLLDRALTFKLLSDKNERRLFSDLLDPSLVKEVPHQRDMSDPECLETAYWFRDYDIATRYTMYWSTVIFSNSLLLRISQVNGSATDFLGPFSLTFLASELRNTANSIYRSVPHLTKYRGYAGMGTTLAMIMAYSVEITLNNPQEPSMQRWATKTLEEVVGPPLVIDQRQFPLVASAKFMSGVPDFVIPGDKHPRWDAKRGVFVSKKP